jgi:ABC-type amino acid transport system permease subunit
MKKADSDIVFGILLILLGFAIGYGIWLWGQQGVYMGGEARQSADIIFIFAFVPAVIIFFLWYKKNLKRPPVERQHGSLGQILQIVLIAIITLAGLIIPAFFFNYFSAVGFAVIIGILVTIFAGIAFYKFKPY